MGGKKELETKILLPALLVIGILVILLILESGYVSKSQVTEDYKGIFISGNVKTLAQYYCLDINNLDENMCLLGLSKVYSYLVTKYKDFNILGRAITYNSRKGSWRIGLYVGITTTSNS